LGLSALDKEEEISPFEKCSYTKMQVSLQTKLQNSLEQCRMLYLPQILVIESDTKVARLLKSELNIEGYQVHIVHNGSDGLIAARSYNVDLIVLGSLLPDISSLEICQRLRTTGNPTSIVVLTNQGTVGERIAYLNAGANDCISKPFDLAALIARIRVHLGHSQERTDLLQFGDLVLNRMTCQVHRRGEMIELTKKEFDLLEYFMVYPNQVISQELLLERVWGFDFSGTSNVVEVYVGYLRRKLEAHNKKRLIHTVRSIGYILRLK